MLPRVAVVTRTEAAVWWSWPSSHTPEIIRGYVIVEW